MDTEQRAEPGISREPVQVGYKCPPVAHQFKPGNRANPHGRPKGLRQALDSTTFLAQTADGQLVEVTIPKGETARQALFRVLVGRALNGSDAAMKEVLDRAYGRVPQRHAQADGTNIPSAITIVEVHSPPVQVAVGPVAPTDPGNAPKSIELTPRSDPPESLPGS